MAKLFFVLAPFVFFAAGWALRGIVEKVRGRRCVCGHDTARHDPECADCSCPLFSSWRVWGSKTNEGQVLDLELRLQSKHNALKIAIAGRDEALERLRASWQARSDEHASTNRNAVQCGVQRADGAPCTLEREHLGHPHSYAGASFERIFDGFACPLCGRTDAQ